MKVVLLGATRGLGRSLARVMAARGERLCLAGRDDAALAKSARDLEARGAAGTVETVRCDLSVPATFAAALDQADALLEGFDTVVVTAALHLPQDQLEQDPEFCDEMLAVNFAHTLRFCEEARTRLLARGGGTLCVYSSVSGDRGRQQVSLYGATKAGLSRYLESLDHAHRAQGLVTICVKPGFIHTSMTEGMQPPPFAGQPDPVARRVMKAIDRGWPVVYAPPIWSLVMFVIKRLPRAVMRRMKF
jgi:short-subunit dehydrogenase